MLENQNPGDISFEQALHKLETIVQQLEQSQDSLDNMIQLYEEGLSYAKLCRMKLEAAETRINILSGNLNSPPASEENNG
ncbi:MAG: exodeoxyribonuclease VII small subunit [Candidatus Cloacimonetes bacterium]|nr:exodeoxyribonuclease VII small subunit [Candidatus Cloacimonadota bacterium]